MHGLIEAVPPVGFPSLSKLHQSSAVMSYGPRHRVRGHGIGNVSRLADGNRVDCTRSHGDTDNARGYERAHVEPGPAPHSLGPGETGAESRRQFGRGL